MFIKSPLVLVMLLCVGCAGSVALTGLPTVADGTQSRWIYRCATDSIAVEYANRGGRYSATLEMEDGKQVLDVTQQGSAITATLPPLRWASPDGVLFTLSRDGEPVLTDCYAVRQEEEGNLHIRLNNLFAR